jgi:hypothetical protein
LGSAAVEPRIAGHHQRDALLHVLDLSAHAVVAQVA